MSTIRYQEAGITISTYAGPAEVDDIRPDDRRCVQIDAEGNILQMPLRLWETLVDGIERIEISGPGLYQMPEVD